MRPGLVLSCLLVAALSVPAVVEAAPVPVDLGPGAHPHVGIDRNGTAHLTWGEVVPGQLADVAHYCQIPVNGSGCTRAHQFTYPAGAGEGEDSGVWPLLPGGDGSRVLVIDARCCTNYATKFLYSSGDGGASFDAGANVGNDNNLGADIHGSALYTAAGALNRPAESVLTFGSLATIGLSFQATNTVGPPSSSTAANVLTQGDATDGSLAISGNTLVAAWTNIDDHMVYWRQYLGAGDVNNSANWSPITPLDVANIDSGSRLAGGPNGIYIAYNTGGSGAEHIVVRKLTGTAWSAPTTVVATGSPRRHDFTQDEAGGLHLVWQDSHGTLRYRRGEISSVPGPVSFGGSFLVAGAPANGNFPDLRIGVIARGFGWVTWNDGSPQHVKALPLTLALPPPVEGATVNAVPDSGTVLVEIPATTAGHARATGSHAAAAGFVPLQSVGGQIPVGSKLDTTHGKVHLIAATNATGGTQDGHFNGGLFVIGQSAKNPLTTLSMTGGGLGSCGKVPPGGSPRASAAKAKKRTLFGNAHGRFSTRGRYSVATVRGTKWTVTDTCKGTLTAVRQGTVVVRDLVKHRSITLKKGHHYLARR